MAARLVYPDRPIILLSGDGAFTFTISDLECAVRQKLHFVAIIADDQGWGITRTGHLEQFGRPISSSLDPSHSIELRRAWERMDQSRQHRKAYEINWYTLSR